jgi:(1->4)-alpha-D-glucan 1-alpha-D-glucosylmutase
VEGSKQAHLIAFCRGEQVAVLAPRWNLRLGKGFGATTVEVPEGRWNNILSGEDVSGGKNRLQNLFERFPVALLVRTAGANDASI